MTRYHAVLALLLIAGAGPLPDPLHGQVTATATTEDNFRAAPNGTRLATVQQGARLHVAEQQENWRSATLEGWIWAPSVRAEPQDGHDLVVSAQGGENLRSEPNGTIVARLLPGMRLTRLAEEGRWIRVQRRGWIWEPSLQIASQEPAPNETTAAPARAQTWAQPGEQGVELLGSPGQDTLAHIRPRASLQVLDTQGNWARVRLEGWAWAPDLATGETGHPPTRLPIDSLAAEPNAHNGRIVDWEIQFIALERAEAIRHDFYEGEPYILARAPGDRTGFVYIAVPPDQLNEVSRTTALQRLRVLARVRSGWSRLLDAPVLDLLAVVENGG